MGCIYLVMYIIFFIMPYTYYRIIVKLALWDIQRLTTLNTKELPDPGSEQITLSLFMQANATITRESGGENELL